MRNIIIDCDPGHDDAIAILLALAHQDKLKIRAITTIGGNQSLEKVTLNALKIIDFVGESIPVAKGSTGPLCRQLRIAPEAHGDSGMDGPVLPEPISSCSTRSAVQEMAEIIKSIAGSITLVCLGPLTNIALFIKTYPTLCSKIEAISLMGGGLSKGNVTKAAEFNIYVDPEAADIVFKSGIPIIMSGLDVTNKAYILAEEYQKLRTRGPVSRLVSDLLDFYSRYGKEHGYIGNAMHDPCAVAYLLQPELFKGQDYYVTVVTDSEICRGMTLADRRPRPEHPPNVKVLLEVDRCEFVNLLFSSFAILDQKLGGLDEY